MSQAQIERASSTRSIRSRRRTSGGLQMLPQLAGHEET
jgi:hypothetical protein